MSGEEVSSPSLKNRTRKLLRVESAAARGKFFAVFFQKSSASLPQHYTTIQALRALAALFVVGFHASVLWYDRGSGIRWENGNAGVDLFFVISGCLMLLSSQKLIGRVDGWRIFVLRRLVRIVPMYWLATALKLVAVALVPALALHARPTLWNAVASFLFLPSKDAAGDIVPILPVGWTLTFEMLFYAVFAAALLLALDPVIVVAPCMLLLAAASLLPLADWPIVAFLADPIVLEFLLGLLIARLWRRHAARFPGRMVMALIGLAGLACIALVETHTVWQRSLVWGGGSGALVAAALALDSTIRRAIPALLVRLGEASYSLYLTHGFVLPLVGAAVAALRLGAPWFGPVLIGASLVLTGLVALAAYRLVERPMTQRLQRLTEP